MDPHFINRSAVRRISRGRCLAAFTAVALVTSMLAGAVKAEPSDKDDQPVAGDKTESKTESPAKPGIKVDASTQEHLGLKVETPVVASWQPCLRATGRVANPLAFLAAVTEFEAASAEVDVAQAELARTEKLASQENASPRVLEAARAAVMRNTLALQAARTKLAADWGTDLAARTNLASLADALQRGELSLVKLSPPVGVFPSPAPSTATLIAFNNETNELAAEYADTLNIDPATQVQTLLYLVKKKLPAGLAVTARLPLPGESVAGVQVPAAAVLRYEGLAWVYVQMDTNQFVRAGIPLDRPLGTGWFVAGPLSTTNRLVVIGAQSLLSAELSSGAFTTGERD
jgi:hypothetical protein